VIWVARPLAVLAATAGSPLTAGQRLFVAWICPRGIVAAAVAGLFHIILDGAGIAGGDELEALVFVTVAATVALQGLTAGRIARLLGIDSPTPVGFLIVGADRLGRFIGRTLQSLDRQVVLVDRNPVFCRAARAEGLSVYEGDALSVDTLEDAGARYADTVIALSRNPELNALVAQRVRDNFLVERVLALADDADETTPHPAMGPLPGSFPSIDDVNRLLRAGRLRLVEYQVPADKVPGRALGELPFGDGEFAVVLRRRAGVLLATGDLRLAPEDRLWCARPQDADSTLAGLLGPSRALDPSGSDRPVGSDRVRGASG
jgi:Trk K+ transport system NAD-binding subunit